MTTPAETDIGTLRQIGWEFWDPIGIRQIDDLTWRTTATDEYDRYLVHAASMIYQGCRVEAAADYLDQIASEHMGLGPIGDDLRIASMRTVEALVDHLLRQGACLSFGPLSPK